MLNRSIPDVVHFERKMRGSCQSSLVKASDGCRYVLKMLDNPEGSDALFHEALGSGLAQVLGLPVPTWRVLNVSESFIEENPQVWFESGGRLTRPTPGLHFGSAFVEALPGGETYQLVPASWHPRLVNAGDFSGMLLLDLWANHLDNRQALFVQIPRTRQLKAVFIDHGQMFGPTSSLRMRIGKARFLDTRVYSASGTAGLLSHWQKRMSTVSATTISYLMDAVPRSWKRPGYPEIILDRLLEMQAGVPEDVSRLRSILEADDSLLTSSPGDFGRRTKLDPVNRRNRSRTGMSDHLVNGSLHSTERAALQAGQFAPPSIGLDKISLAWERADTNRRAIPCCGSIL